MTATTETTEQEWEVGTAGVLTTIDPTQAVIGTNVRLDPRLDKAFIASVRERGVLVPVVGYRDEESRFVVLYGQRRTLAAVEVGLSSIPAYVVTEQAEADRLIDQMAENDHRAALTEGERVKGFEQLAALGVTPTQIAKKTATPKATVETALAVAKSELATKAVDRWDFLTLDQAAGLAEFEDDTDAVEALVVAAKEGRFDHKLQRLRDDREDNRLYAEGVAALTEAGVRLVDRPAWDDKTTLSLDWLKHDGQDVTAEAHKDCPGHAAWLSVGWTVSTLDLEDDEEPDDYEDDDESEDERPQVRGAVAHFVCTDWVKQGHTDRYATSAPKQKAADMTPAEREKAAAERRDVIESNKAWRSAETVRRNWILTFLTRKTPPKGAGQFIAASLLDHPGILSDMKMPELRGALLGYNREQLAKAAEAASEPRSFVLALGHILASHEAQTGTHSWRNVHSGTALYLRFLEANGYTLSAVERRAAGLPPERKDTV